MRSFSLTRHGSRANGVFRFVMLAGLLLCFVFSVAVKAQQARLTLVDIITVLRSKKATAAEKNRLLTEGVRQRGITFGLNDDLEKELRNAGASDQLVAAIRELSAARIEDTPAETSPKVEPTPEPVVAPSPVLPDSVVFRNRGNSSFVMGDFAAAITDYDRAIVADPGDSSVFYSRAMAHYNLRNFSLAVSDFNRFMELEPATAAIYLKRGAALEQLGENDKAMADYRKAAELDATSDAPRTAIQRLQEAMAKTEGPRQRVIIVQNKPTEPVAPVEGDKAKSTIQNFGALNRFAERLVQPTYPTEERNRKTQGVVTVELVIDEDGKVSGVRATSGPKTLRQAAEDAVKKSKFNPVMVDNMAVKATGFISFNFKVN